MPDDYQTDPEFEPLLPSPRLELALSQGLSLPRGSRRAPEWHRLRPPDVVVSHPDPETPINLSIHQRRLSGDQVHELGTLKGMGSLRLPVDSLDSRYPQEIEGQRASWVKSSAIERRQPRRPCCLDCPRGCTAWWI